MFSNLALTSKNNFMLPYKSTNKIWELKNGFTHKWLEPDLILSSLKCFSFSSLAKSLNSLKQRGYSFEVIFSCLVSLPFLGLNNVHGFTKSTLSRHIEARKDVFYRLKNNAQVCWRKILWMFALKAIKIGRQKGSAADDALKCLVFDDSTLAKTGEYFERISRVWDHVSNRFILGYKFLLMGYWDGVSFIPLDFSLHREKGKNKGRPYGLPMRDYKKQFRKKRQKGSYTEIREKETDRSKIDMALKLFTRAMTHGIKVDYVLMDSWFTCGAFIRAVRKVKKQAVHLIGMYKIPRTLFGFSHGRYTYSQIRNMLGKAKRCRKLRLYYKETVVDYEGQPLKMFFSKQGKNGKWKVFITTDRTLSFIRMIEIYQIRWSIEVFFKESKQLFGLGKCQSTDFDSQIADTTITMIQHILMTLKYRFEQYESKGALFDQVKQDVLELRLNERLWGLFLELIKVIETLFDGIDEMEIIERILNSDEAYKMFNRLFHREIDICNAA